MEPFVALLVSDDPGSLAIVRVLEDYGVKVKIVVSAKSAEPLINTTKFDLGIFDHDLPDALSLALKRGVSANPKMIFALVRNNSQVKDLQGKRVHFLMQKPLSTDLFARSLRAAYGTMLRERRITFRHPVQIRPAQSLLINEEGNQSLKSPLILDISQTGLCIQTQEILQQGANMQIDFHLPEIKDLIHTTGSVMWTRASGRTGIRFTKMPTAEQKHLIAWLDSKLPYEIEAIPKVVLTVTRQERAELQI